MQTHYLNLTLACPLWRITTTYQNIRRNAMPPSKSQQSTKHHAYSTLFFRSKSPHFSPAWPPLLGL
jgi:hypothetical protein